MFSVWSFTVLDAISLHVEAPTVQKKFRTMIDWWMRNPNEAKRRENTWQFLAESIRRCGNIALAEKVENHEEYLADKKKPGYTDKSPCSYKRKWSPSLERSVREDPMKLSIRYVYFHTVYNRLSIT